jgi:hypothetical protein
VPGNPLAPDRDGVPTEQYNALGAGKPQLYCQWSPCASGCCLAFDGNEKFYEPTEWLRYLINHLLKPGAKASRANHPQLREFTFDHRLDGMVVGCRRDNRELFAITVTNNRITRRVLRDGDPEYYGEPPLAYQEAIDRDRSRRRRRRRRAGSPAARASGSAGVVDLASRRPPA